MKLRIEFSQREKEALINSCKIGPEMDIEIPHLKAKGKFGVLEISNNTYEVNLVEDFMVQYSNIIGKAVDMLKTLLELYMNLISEWFDDAEEEIIEDEEQNSEEELICPVQRLVEEDETGLSRMEQVAIDLTYDKIEELRSKAEAYQFDSGFEELYEEVLEYVASRKYSKLQKAFADLTLFIKSKKLEVTKEAE